MTSETDPKRARYELFVVSFLALFLELTCIRWFPAHVLLLTFFTNAVLLASFVGLSIGCLVSRHSRNFIRWTPFLLLIGILAAHGAELMPRMERMVDMGDNSQVVYFGADRHADPAKFAIPVEALAGFFFFLICLIMVGPGQELGRALGRVPDRVWAYTIDIGGSLTGIALFALSSYLQLSPAFWFGIVVLICGWMILRYVDENAKGARILAVVPLLLVLIIGSWRTGKFGFDRDTEGTTYWSPYYRLDYEKAPRRNIAVNLIGFQRMEPLDRVAEYTIPHMMRRDAQKLAGEDWKPYEDVLIIGAGSGNDMSRALAWNVKHVDAVEIDPIVQRLGKEEHPAQPYSDPRVTPINDDGRNFLRSTDKKYDLVIYALVDSLVLHSTFSNIRLESFLFTKEAFDDVKHHLKPNGVFATYNFFRQGWVVARLEKTLKASFGNDPIAMMLPYRAVVEPDATFGAFTIFLSGSDDALAMYRKAFAEHPGFWLDATQANPQSTRNGFLDTPAAGAGELGYLEGAKDDKRWMRFGIAKINQPTDDLPLATDDWPFLYLRRPMIPALSMRAAIIMGTIGIGLIWFFDRSRRKHARETVRTPFDLQMLFLGAGFMLVETKAVVRMALLFGGTWMVNSIVFFAVLVVIMMANLVVLRFRPKNLVPFYVGVILALIVAVFVPLDMFLGMERVQQVVLSSLLVAAPIFFAGVIFATAFARTSEPDRAFGANIAGAMIGGIAEYASMQLGFQHVGYVAIGFYLLAYAAGTMQSRRAPTPTERNEEPATA